MDVSSINSDIIRGNVTTIILKALTADDRYGYDILREIEVKSGGQYKLKQPTLYSCLKRLEKQGLINSYWGDESDTEGGRRRYYSLTDSGRGYLNKMQSEYEYSRTILDSLLTEEKFDFESNDAPFDINSLRPYTKRNTDDSVKGTAEQKTKPKSPTLDEKPKNDTTYNAPSFFNSGEAIDNSAEINTVNEKQSAPSLFEPFDRGKSSYDNGYRHTSKSVNDILGQISDIMDSKTEEKTASQDVNDKVEEKTAHSDVNDKAEKNHETPAAGVDENNTNISNTSVKAGKEKYEQISYDSILNNPDIAKDTSPSSDDKAEKRANAKKALGIGQFSDAKIDLDKFKTAEKKSDVSIEKSIEISTDKHIEEAAVKTNEQPVITDETDGGKSRQSAAHELLFGKREKKPAELPPIQQQSILKEPFSIFDKYSKKAETAQHEKESKKIELTPSPVAPASSYSFRKDKDSVVNYRDAFSSLRENENVKTQDDAVSDTLVQKPASNIDLKTKLFSAGYKLRPYTRANTEDYYSLNYIKKNRINRDCYAILYALICVEVLIGWLIFRDKFTPIYYAAVCIGALLIPAIPFVIWSVNPDKRVRADFNFRTSVLNRLMLYLNLLVVVCLIGFFGIGANINDGASMIAPILIPALLLLNIPLSSLIYLILYKTNKYHIS